MEKEQKMWIFCSFCAMSRELFGGDTDLMNRVIEQISVMSSYKTAVAFLSSKADMNEENEATIDFLELLKKYFNQSA